MASYNTKPFTLYATAIRDFLNGSQDWDSDPHYAVLLSSGYGANPNHATLVEIQSHEISDNDYNRIDMTGEVVTLVAGVTTCDANDVSFGSSVTISARFIAIVVGTVASSASSDRLVGYMQLNVNDEDVVSNASNFQVTWNDEGGLFSTVSNNASFGFSDVVPVLNLPPTSSPFEGAVVSSSSDIPVAGGPSITLPTDTLWDSYIDYKWDADHGQSWVSSPDSRGSETWSSRTGSGQDPPVVDVAGGYTSMFFDGRSCMESTLTFINPADRPYTRAIVIQPLDTLDQTVVDGNPNTSGSPFLRVNNGKWQMFGGGEGSAVTTDRQLVVVHINGDRSWIYSDGQFYDTTESGEQVSYAEMGSYFSGSSSRFRLFAIYIGRGVNKYSIPFLQSYCESKWGF